MASAVHRYAIGAHVIAAAWLIVNGVGHQGHVLWKAWRRTLTHPR
jgi:hypothetical protein